MELPSRLRQATDDALTAVDRTSLAKASAELSRRYRAEVRDGRPPIGSESAALAYAATRMPATYAAIGAALAGATEAIPDFAPVTMLDAGAGPGTAAWAASAVWPTIGDALLV